MSKVERAAAKTKTARTVVAEANAADWVPLDAIQKLRTNRRKIDDAAVADARASLVRFGFCNALVVWGSKRTLVAGHARVLALEAILAEDPPLSFERNAKLASSLGAGPRNVPVRLREFESEAEARAYALRDNNAFGKWDMGGVEEELHELAQDGADVAGLGWSDKELETLLGEDVSRVREVNVSQLRDQFFISVRGPLPKQPEAIRKLQDALEAIGDVDVNVGIVKAGGLD